MAYSPSPTARTHRSPTPPTQPLSKRDKRRAHHVSLQQDLQNEFDGNREHHYRSQLIALQHDMNLVTSADPYGPEPLDDAPESIARLLESQASNTPYQSDMSTLAGRWYTEFVHEVNAAKTEREMLLIQLDAQHEQKLARLKYECDYRLMLAAKEAECMKNTLRERLVQTLTSKRGKLMKEKEMLDIADTNALLLHPSQFSITSGSGVGVGNGGGGTRKTRMTRGRGEVEDVGEGFGRKRRRIGDDDHGSPSRGSGNGNGNGYSTPNGTEKNGTAAVQTDRVYSISHLFTEKELNFQSHQAQIATRHFFSTSAKDGDMNGSGREEGDKSGDDESSDKEDEDVSAPGMERTASQNVHITRSTRNIGGLSGLNILGDLAEKQPRRPTLPYATLHSAQGKNGVFLPAPSRLMPEELEEDMVKIAEAKTRGPGDIDKKQIDEAVKPVKGARSGLAPDWPVYLDVHLVDVDPRKARQ